MEKEIQISDISRKINDFSLVGKVFVNSGFYGFKNVEQAMALMLQADADGIPFAKAVQQYSVIQGRPSLKAEAMLTRFQENGGSIKWISRTAKSCKLFLSHPKGGELEVEWTLERAKAAGLGDKDNWKKYPVQMLSARCVSEGVRAIYPACLGGCYTPEEVMDFDTEPADRQAEPTSEVKVQVKKQPERIKPISKKNVQEAVIAPSEEPKAKEVQEEPASKKDSFLKAMSELQSLHPDAYKVGLQKFGIIDITILPEKDYPNVYRGVKKQVDECLAVCGGSL